ncbi:MAG: hypothetical protein LUF87_04990 [Alistipes sp.]|nr:hypothetical protein [Alistipes sp.]
MTGNIAKIKKLPCRVSPYLRVRHFRGRGIHSPFVYGIIRNALIFGKGFYGQRDRLYTYLKLIGVPGRTAMKLQNLHNYCEYSSAAVYSSAGREVLGSGEPALMIFTTSCPARQIADAIRETGPTTGAVAIISPRSESARFRICKELARREDCISIDTRGVMLFFYGSGHAPRHYKL